MEVLDDQREFLAVEWGTTPLNLRELIVELAREQPLFLCRREHGDDLVDLGSVILGFVIASCGEDKALITRN